MKPETAWDHGFNAGVLEACRTLASRVSGFDQPTMATDIMQKLGVSKRSPTSRPQRGQVQP